MTGSFRSLAILVAAAAILAVACSDAGGGDSAPTASPAAGSDLEARIDEFMAGRTQVTFGELNREQLGRMLSVAPEDDGPFYMVNLIRFREFAQYPDGRDDDLSGREANDRYQILPILLEIGAAPVFVANVEQQLLGDPPPWDQIGIVRYPSRAAFLEMTQRDDLQELVVHKDAGVEESIVLVTNEIVLPELPPLESVPHPPSESDSPFAMVHVMSFFDQAQYADARETNLSGREALALYEESAGVAALPLGVRPALWLEVEGEFIGDGREWSQVRVNRFPSHATFQALISDPTWMSGTEHRAAGLADSYSMMTLPIIDLP